MPVNEKERKDLVKNSWGHLSRGFRRKPNRKQRGFRGR